jgi:protoporphyrinogen oxidase
MAKFRFLTAVPDQVAMTYLTILGGGPAGLGVAFYAQRARIPFILFEKSAQLGGMCRTLRHGEHFYDCGAHRFHDQDREITRDVLDLMGDEMLAVEAPSMIWDRGRFVDFPPTPLNAILSRSPIEVWRIAVELLRAHLRPRECVSFEDFAISQFGETLARRIALNYSEKLWGLPAAQLSPNIATHRLKGMTLRSLFFELILPRKKTSHIDGAFLYPRRGYGRIVENIERTLPPDSIRLAQEIVRIECEGGRIARIVFADGHAEEPRDRVVSTLPLTVLVKFLGEQMSDEARQAAARLRFRQIRLFFLRLKRPQLSANASIYIPDPQFCISRLYEPKNRSAALAPPGETSVVVEVPCFLDDPIQRMSNEDLAERVITELVALTLVNRAEVVEWKHHFLANAYPVYSLDYSRDVSIITEELAQISNLSTIGRAGLFLYSHLHDQLRLAKDYVAAHLQSRLELESEPALESLTMEPVTE